MNANDNHIDLSVILATYRRPQILHETLDSFTRLKTESIKWELIVVDNAEDTNTEKIVSGFIDRLPLHFLVELKPGKSNALNHATKIARGDLFIITDDDIIADSDWLIEMWKGAKRWPDFSVFGGRILPRYPSGMKPRYENHRFITDYYVIADWDIAEGPYEAGKVWGPNMAVRAKLFRNGWYFDPNIGPNGKNYILGNETDFTIRLEKAGFRSVYLPNSLVYHQIRPEQLKTKWLYQRAFKDGRMIEKRSNLPHKQILFGLPRSLLRRLIILGIKRLLYLFHRETACQLGIAYWKIRGMIHQYREDAFKKGK